MKAIPEDRSERARIGDGDGGSREGPLYLPSSPQSSVGEDEGKLRSAQAFSRNALQNSPTRRRRGGRNPSPSASRKLLGMSNRLLVAGAALNVLLLTLVAARLKLCLNALLQHTASDLGSRSGATSRKLGGANDSLLDFLSAPPPSYSDAVSSGAAGPGRPSESPPPYSDDRGPPPSYASACSLTFGDLSSSYEDVAVGLGERGGRVPHLLEVAVVILGILGFAASVSGAALYSYGLYPVVVGLIVVGAAFCIASAIALVLWSFKRG